MFLFYFIILSPFFFFLDLFLLFIFLYSPLFLFLIFLFQNSPFSSIYDSKYSHHHFQTINSSSPQSSPHNSTQIHP